MLRAAIGKYLPDLILGAGDGIITTLAIVSGVVGASLSAAVVLILGLANLLADGLSMGASNVLARRSQAAGGLMPTLSVAAWHGLATFIGFVFAGFIPLLAYCLPWSRDIQFETAASLALAALFTIGAGRAVFTKRNWLTSGLEMLILGGIAASVAYAVGALGSVVIRQVGL